MRFSLNSSPSMCFFKNHNHKDNYDRDICDTDHLNLIPLIGESRMALSNSFQEFI